MNSKDIQFISEAYFEINEANRGEKYRGLTSKERRDERNQREPVGSALGDLTTKDPLTKRRTFRHQHLRGISPKKRRADLEREYVYNKNEWEKKNPGRTYGDYDDYDDDDYDHSPESDPYDNTPRMPGNKPGRRKPFGQNSIRKVQPYLNFSRARAKRKEELSQEQEEKNREQKRIQQQNNDNKWKTDRAIEDMQKRLKSPGNKIVPFQREEIELILNYLLDEGYVDSFETAELIFENMSDEWKYEIVEDFKDLTPDKSERVKARHAELVSDIMKNYDEVNRLRKKPFLRYRPGIKRKIRELVGKTKKNAILAQNAGDALIRTSISREAKIKHLKNKISELEPKNKIVPFQREEIELILNYLINEGYVDSFETAELIFENMSDEWIENILSEGNLTKRPSSWRSLRSVTGPGVPDSPYQSTTSISNLAAQQRAREAAMRSAQPINNSSYSGRVQSGANDIVKPRGFLGIDALAPRVHTNPNFQGRVGGIRGTQDRMPGTTPSSNLQAPSRSTKSTIDSQIRTPAQRTYGRNLGYT